MSGSSSDSKPNAGLANSFSNVFKLASVNGLKWMCYTGPNSSTLEVPKDDPVLKSYAKLINNGYACAWHRLSPCTDGLSGEAKDLWVFFFTDLPDISDTLAEGLHEESSGSWEDGMTPASSTMLYRALHNLIERSLMNESFLPLGKWFARSDPSVAPDGSSRGCFLCSFSFFIHAHLYICASVDMKAGPGLQPLLPSHVNQALASSTGLQVILSPSGINAMMTGHSYKTSDAGIDEILEEWKLFYPRRFSQDSASSASSSSSLPAAIEVVLGGVRMRYPSQFVFVYHGEETLPTPPPSPMDEPLTEELVEGVWQTSNCNNVVQQQKDSVQCRCLETSSRGRRLSSTLDLPLRAKNLKQSRYEPYPSSSARRARELATPGSLSLMTFPVLNAKKKLSRHGLPKYTTPIASPALAPQPLSSPTPYKQQSSTLLPPTISLGSAVARLGGPPRYSNCKKPYDQTRVLTETSTATQHYKAAIHGWWDCLNLPDNLQDLLKQVQPPKQEKEGLRFSRLASSSVMSPPAWSTSGSPSPLTTLLSPTSKKAASPVCRGKTPTDRPSPTPGPTTATTAGTNTSTSSGGLPVGGGRDGGGGERPGMLKGQRTSIGRVSPVMKGQAMGKNESGAGINIGSLERILAHEKGFENTADSPVSVEGEQPGTDSLDGLGITGSDPDTLKAASEGLLLKSNSIDVFSENAVKISEGDLDQIFASDGEDEPDQSELTHFPFSGVPDMGRSDEKMDSSLSSKSTKIPSTDPIALSELSRIYPTPPSVDTSEEKYMYEESKLFLEERGDHASPWDSGSGCVDEEVVCVPPEFAPLTNLRSSKLKLPKHCVYVNTQPSPGSTDKNGPSTGDTTSRTLSSNKSEPQQFIFPPPPTLAYRAQKIESLTLPLTSKKRISPHIFTPQLLSVSPAFPLKGPGRFLSTTTSTPLESPFDTVTPTPLSATTTNRLMPVLPEAHALYINLALLDSALGANFSEMMSINTGNIMSTIQSFMNFSSKRMRLDSVGSMSALDNPGSSTPDLLNLKEEKPVMTFGIADYPSLGFREALGGMVGAQTPSGSKSWSAPYGALSRLINDFVGEEQCNPTDTDTGTKFPIEKFLELLQDYCLHLCFSGCHDSDRVPQARSEHMHTHLMIRPNWSDQKNSSGRLYHSHSVVTAVLNGKQLVPKSRGVPAIKPPSTITLGKEDNQASWILELLTLPTKFVVKRLKELRSTFQFSFHHAHCLKFTTKGPLTLKDLQQLTPSQTALGDECAPLPMQPVMVGYDHEWLTVSPLALPAWDKLLFEPYSTKKNVVYFVLAPNSSFVPQLQKFFRDLSIVFKNCNLGQHIPLTKGVGEDGIILTTPTSEATKDPHTDTRHGSPAVMADVGKLCKKIIAPLLTSLPSSSEEILSTHVASGDHTPVSNSNQPVPPLSIVLYVVCSGDRSSKEAFQILHVFSEMLAGEEEIPASTRERLILQLLESRELFGPNSGQSSQLRSLAFSVYTRCHPTLDLLDGAHSLTASGPLADKIEQAKMTPRRHLYAPPFVLSPEPPLSSMGPLMGPHTHHILFNPEEGVLFCGYCISPDQRWLLVVCCDRQGELLDTSVIGIQPSQMDNSRILALQKLWSYLVSVISGTLFKWNVVITRFGKPSNSEIRDWPNIVDDGLLNANQLLRNSCTACSSTSSRPQLTNVLMVSVQPERNIQLFPSIDLHPSISHVLVLPQDPRAASGPCLTPSATDTTGDDFDMGFAGASAGGDIGFPMDTGLMGDIDSELQSMDFGEDFPSTQLGVAQGMEDTLPKATGYLISTSPPGQLPDEFFGHDKPQTACSLFKVLLHCHRSEKAFADNPQETLGSTLLCFDALSWLTVDQATRRRRSCLPIHLFILSKMYHLFGLLDQCR